MVILLASIMSMFIALATLAGLAILIARLHIEESNSQRLAVPVKADHAHRNPDAKRGVSV